MRKHMFVIALHAYMLYMQPQAFSVHVANWAPSFVMTLSLMVSAPCQPLISDDAAIAGQEKKSTHMVQIAIARQTLLLHRTAPYTTTVLSPAKNDCYIDVLILLHTFESSTL